ncbi:hypothetical protein G6F63_013876 [Rhizopus arrhizus]|nr:hypothetical protein G6F63_013876 [Rhizopus arrhizus]
MLTAEIAGHGVLHIRLPGLGLLARHLHHQKMRAIIHVDLIRPGGVVDAPFPRHQQGGAIRLADFAAARQLQRDLVAGFLGTSRKQFAAAYALRAAVQFADLHPAQAAHRHAVAKTRGEYCGYFQWHERAADTFLPAGAIQEVHGRAVQKG